MQDNQGRDVDLKCYKGKILLIINVASQWYLIWAWKKFIVPQCPLSIFCIFFFMGFIQYWFLGIFLTMKLHQFLDCFFPFSPHKQRIWDSMRVLPCFHVGNYFELEEVYTSLEITWRSEGLTIWT